MKCIDCGEDAPEVYQKGDDIIVEYSEYIGEWVVMPFCYKCIKKTIKSMENDQKIYIY